MRDDVMVQVRLNLGAFQVRESLEAPQPRTHVQNRDVGAISTQNVPQSAAINEALLKAKHGLTSLLAMNEHWHALQRLQAKEDADANLQNADGEVLKHQLISAASADPAFLAYQFVEAALACFNIGSASNATASEPVDAIFYPIDRSEQNAHHDLPSQSYGPVLSQPPQSSVPQDLSARIPMLTAHERRPMAQEHQTSDTIEHRITLLSAPSSETNSIDRYSQQSVTSTATAAIISAPVDDPTATRFQSEAVGVAEAEVKIVSRPPKKQLLDARLPPLPFANRQHESQATHNRGNRSTAVKWTDSNPTADTSNYRPVGSALDEAQVSIIVTGQKSPAQSRADRRALGVAPDREDQMQRFLGALSPKESHDGSQRR